jgi:hypothetical protein
LCLGHPDVRRYHRELIADIAASFPGIRGFAIFGGDFYSSMTAPSDGEATSMGERR